MNKAPLLSPQLPLITAHENNYQYSVSQDTKLLCFDNAFEHNGIKAQIPYWGSFNAALSNYWSHNLRDIVDSNFIKLIHPSAILARDIRQPQIYIHIWSRLLGFLFRQYENGIRHFGKQRLPDGLQRYQDLNHPIALVSPSAQPISNETDQHHECFDDMDDILETAMQLYEEGCNSYAQMNIQMPYAVYCFAINRGSLHLIDEAHTTKRALLLRKQAQNSTPPQSVLMPINNILCSQKPPEQHVIYPSKQQLAELESYLCDFYQQLSGEPITFQQTESSLFEKLQAEQCIKDSYCLILIDEQRYRDVAHAIKQTLNRYNIAAIIKLLPTNPMSKNAIELFQACNEAQEPGCAILVSQPTSVWNLLIQQNLFIPVIVYALSSKQRQALSRQLQLDGTPELPQLDRVINSVLKQLNMPRLRSILLKEQEKRIIKWNKESQTINS